MRLLDFLRAITDNLGEGTYALDTDGRVTFMNPAAERMLGWSEAELRGQDMHQAIHFQHADGTPFPREECPLLRAMRSGSVEHVDDDTFTRKDGSMFSVAYISSPIVSNGEMAGAVLAFHDISSHKALDEALRRRGPASWWLSSSPWLTPFLSTTAKGIYYRPMARMMRCLMFKYRSASQPTRSKNEIATSCIWMSLVSQLPRNSGLPIAFSGVRCCAARAR